MKTKKTVINVALQKEICELYNQNNSLRSIARLKNISPNTIKKYLLLNKIKVKSKNIVYKIKNDDELLIGLYCGIWAGDGTQYLDKGYRIKICCDSRNEELIKFIQNILLKLFNKETSVIKEARHRGMIRFNSKFIYYFVYHYLSFDKNKTHSISLKKNVDDYSEQFLKGFILGLMITDGYLKKRFYFNTTSERLANNVLLILKKFNFEGHKYTHNRTKFGWKNLHMISLKKINSQNALKFLNKILKEAEYEEEFFFLKGYNGPVEI